MPVAISHHPAVCPKDIIHQKGDRQHRTSQVGIKSALVAGEQLGAMVTTLLLLRLSLFAAFLSSTGRVSTAFTFAPVPVGGRTPAATVSFHKSWTTTSSRLYNKPSKKKVPEFFIEDDDNVEDTPPASTVSGPGFFIDTTAARAERREADDLSNLPSATAPPAPMAPTAPFFAALAPGAVVTIQVGDVGRARKAWKKRRRSGSPLLVPCSVLSVDVLSTLRGNCLYLLDKFGSPATGSGASKSQGIAIDLQELVTRHRTHLKLKLAPQAELLGFRDNQELVQALFPKHVQDATGVELEEGADDGTLRLRTTSSRMRAQRRAQAAAIVQFQTPQEDAATDGSVTWDHTGMTRLRNSAVDAPSSETNFYGLKPLSAALRLQHVNQMDLGAALETGSVLQAVVFEFDPVGDAGGPLLVMAPNANRVPQRDRSKPNAAPVDAEGDAEDSELPRYTLDELSAGQELSGKVARLTKGGALIDCDVRRLRRDKSWAKVWGRLNFRDAVTDTDEIEAQYRTSSKRNSKKSISKADWFENDFDEDLDGDNIDTFNEFDWDEEDLEDDEDFDVDDDDDSGDVEGEDITHLFTQNPDGTLSYTDPDTGETDTIMTDDEEENEEAEELDENDYEDISHLFQHDDDGSVTFTDPTTGETHKVYSEGDGEDITHLFEQNDDGTLTYKGTDPSNERNQAIQEDKSEKKSAERRAGHVVSASEILKRPHYLRVGDEITVFVKSVSKNSGQFSLTTNASAKDKTAKDLKRESEVTKRLSRLSKQLGGLHGIEQLLGTECDGRVKATSNTGSWLYVEPLEYEIPVGVATTSDVKLESLIRGDNVRIRIEGIDEGRGQLAMHILRRLEA